MAKRLRAERGREAERGRKRQKEAERGTESEREKVSISKQAMDECRSGSGRKRV